MNYYILTLFPKMIANGLNHSIIKRAIDNKIISINSIDIRDFSKNKHKKVDDYAYGGGAGMVMQAQPVYDAFMSLKDKIGKDTKVLYMTPQGKAFNQQKAYELSKEKDLVILCGHYEGIDERAIQEIVTEEISMGDFVLTGGELASMIIIDATARLINGVLGKTESHLNESFSNTLLEYPNYTRPVLFNNKEVPKVLLSGNHKNVDRWKLEQSIIRTYEKRPDLLKKYSMNEEEKNIIKKYKIRKIEGE